MKEKIRKICAQYFPEGIKKILRPIYYYFFNKSPESLINQPRKYNSIYEEVLPIDTIKKLIQNKKIKIVSFDIFDTLLIRPVIQPKDIFYLIATKVNKKYNIDFIKLRYNAENHLKKTNATLQDIYDFIAKENNLKKEIIKDLIEEELATEKLLLYPRSDIKELYDEAVKQEKKIIVVSDMYLPANVLKDILTEKGYNKVEKIYVSNNYKKRKSSGDLYEIVISDLKINPSEILHIGDNYDSDYLKAIEKNITAIYYPSIHDLVFSKNSIFTDIYSMEVSTDPFTRILMGFTFNYIFMNRNKLNDSVKTFNDLEMFAQLHLAPILLYITLFIAQSKDIQKKYSKIFFASRDGYLPQNSYDIIQKYIKNLLPSKYLYVGRRAYYMALEKNFFNYLENNNVDNETNYTLKDIIDCYILDEKLKSKIKKILSIEDLSTSFIKNKKKCINLLLKNKIEILDYVDNLKENATKYYNEKLEIGKRAIIFDLGYSGSVSSALTKMTNVKVDKIYLWETEKNKKLDKKNNTKTFTLFKYRHPTEHLILEELFSPLIGSCIGFKNNKNELIPVFEEIKFDSEMKDDIACVQSTTLEFINKFCELFGEYLPNFKIKDISVLQKAGQFAFAESQFNEEKLFKNIIFPDSVFASYCETLAQKVLKHRPYKNVFDATGFENPNNTINNIPHDVSNIKMKIGIHLHLYNIYMYSELLNYLKDFPVPFDLIITITDSKKNMMIENVFNSLVIPAMIKLIIKIVPNRGRDIAPWLIYTKEYQNNYDLFCHIHSKESNHFSFNIEWRKYLLKNLIEKDSVKDIITLFNSDKQLGCVYADCFPGIKLFIIDQNIPLIGASKEEEIIKNLLSRANISKPFMRYDLRYSVGTMLWYRPKALSPLFDLNLELEDFPIEPIGIGGTIAHAIERLPPFIAETQKFKTKLYTKFKI